LQRDGLVRHARSAKPSNVEQGWTKAAGNPGTPTVGESSRNRNLFKRRLGPAEGPIPVADRPEGP